MKITYLSNFTDLDFVSKGLSVVLGLFDGVHVGHAQLISTAKYISKDKIAVLTFDNNLKQDNSEALLSLDDKLNFIGRLGADEIYVFRANDKFKNIPYLDFINKILIKFDPKNIFCGADFRFGFRALGDINSLKEFFPKVTVLNYVNNADGSKVSSSLIKKYIKEGCIENANLMLGYSYFVRGRVVKGHKNGRKIGFPTINLKLSSSYCLPKKGVYASKIFINGQIYFGMTNVGTHPTIEEENSIIIETYIFDFNSNVYGEDTLVTFEKYIRDEHKYSSLEHLCDELKSNERLIRNYFGLIY